jgi:hypothetical protein
VRVGTRENVKTARSGSSTLRQTRLVRRSASVWFSPAPRLPVLPVLARTVDERRKSAEALLQACSMVSVTGVCT